jgi:hypothetical protein
VIPFFFPPSKIKIITGRVSSKITFFKIGVEWVGGVWFLLWYTLLVIKIKKRCLWKKRDTFFSLQKSRSSRGRFLQKSPFF